MFCRRRPAATQREFSLSSDKIAAIPLAGPDETTPNAAASSVPSSPTFVTRQLDKGIERGLDALTTRTLMGAAYPSPGLYSKFFDPDMQPLVEVVLLNVLFSG